MVDSLSVGVFVVLVTLGVIVIGAARLRRPSGKNVTKSAPANAAGRCPACRAAVVEEDSVFCPRCGVKLARTVKGNAM